MIIDPNGIVMTALKGLNMHVTDVLQAMRTAEYFSLEEVSYGIMETNGQLTVIANKQMEDKQQTLPVPVLMEGKWNAEEILQHGFSQPQLEQILKNERLRAKNVVLMTIDENNRMTLQPKNGSVYYKNVEVQRK